MPLQVPAYAAQSPDARLAPFTIERRDVGPNDVLVDIEYSGICHSDIHQARADWGAKLFPMVPGHEIVGRVEAVGSEVTGYSVGDRVGVGVFVDSCRECRHCREGLEQYCSGMVVTYNGRDKQGEPTYGGYSKKIVVDEQYVLRIPDGLALDVAAPLLCAGITVYSPLRHWNAGPGVRVGIMGLGGLGHMGVKIAHALGAEVTLISHSPNKESDALRLGADQFLLSSDRGAMRSAAMSLDLIVNTISADLDLPPYLNLLDRDGTMVMVGLPVQPLSIPTFSLAGARRSVAGSNIGGIAETQEMLDFCASHGFGSDIELIGIEQVNEAWERVLASDVKYRFVIDTGTLQG